MAGHALLGRHFNITRGKRGAEPVLASFAKGPQVQERKFDVSTLCYTRRQP